MKKVKTTEGEEEIYPGKVLFVSTARFRKKMEVLETE